MDGLRTSRVLVLDNDPKDANRVMEALAKSGVGAIYFSGDEEKLPSEDGKLTGIRLAAIDLDLGIAGDAPAVINVLTTVLNRIIHKDNGPYLAIAWTGSRNDDYYKEFQKKQSDLDCRPIQLIKMTKGEYAGEDSIKTIFEKVSEEMEKAYPLGLLSFWEQTIHDSSGSVMEILPEATDWIDQSKQALRMLLDAAGEADESSAVRLTSLLSSFNALQLDCIETDIASLQAQGVSPLISPLDDIASCSHLDIKAKLNYRLLCTTLGPGTAPGNIYQCATVCPSQDWLFPTLHDLLDEMAEPNPGNEQILKDGSCLAVAMEITPLCDYRRSRLSRFICGIALPYAVRRRAKRPTGFLRTDHAPIFFEDGPLAGTNLLVWNSRWTVTVPSAMARRQAGLFRLRQAPLIDVQSWLAGQQNRPGYLSLTTQW